MKNNALALQKRDQVLHDVDQRTVVLENASHQLYQTTTNIKEVSLLGKYKFYLIFGSLSILLLVLVIILIIVYAT